MQGTKDEQRSLSEARENQRTVSEAREKPTNEELAAQAKAGSREALGMLWEQNRGLLALLFRRLIANTGNRQRMEAAGVTFEDLEQEGYLALVKAVQGYDPAAGAKFTTYMNYHIKTAFFAAVGLYTQRQRREPLNSAASLDEPLSTEEGEGSTRGDLVPDPAAAVPFQEAEERLYTQQLHAALDECLERIEARQAAVVRGRYYEGKTLRELAEPLGLSYQRIRDIEHKGLAAMRKRRELAQYREEVLSARAYQFTGFGAWAAGGSSPERWAEYWERREAERAAAARRQAEEEIAQLRAKGGDWWEELLYSNPQPPRHDEGGEEYFNPHAPRGETKDVS